MSSFSIDLTNYTFSTESKQYEDLIEKLKKINYETLSPTEKNELSTSLTKISKEVPKMIKDLQEIQEIIKKQSKLENSVSNNKDNLSAEFQGKEAKIIQINPEYDKKIIDQILSLSEHLV